MIKCPTCGKWFKSLGYARHRTMHYEAKQREKAAVNENGHALDADGWPELPPDGHPLQLLGARLADLLTEDHWNNVEPMLLDVWKAVKPKAPALDGEDEWTALDEAYADFCIAWGLKGGTWESVGIAGKAIYTAAKALQQGQQKWEQG